MARKDRILIEHLGKEYIVDIIDCKPDNVVDIIECDVEVDIEYKDMYILNYGEMVERKRSRLFPKQLRASPCQWTRVPKHPLNLLPLRTLQRFGPSSIRRNGTFRELDIPYALLLLICPLEWVDRDSTVSCPLGIRKRARKSKLDSRRRTKAITLRVKGTGSAKSEFKTNLIGWVFSVCHILFQMALCRTASTVIPSVAYQVARASPVFLGHVTRLNNYTLPTVQKRTFILGTIINVSFGILSWTE